MKIVLNPTKKFYKEKFNKTVRMGNFPESGKEIEFDDEEFLKLFKILKKPIERKKQLSLLQNKQSLKKQILIMLLVT